MNRTRAAWIDVELENIVHNVKAVQALAQKDAGRPIMAMPVIKGNAYGHGIFEVAHILGESGVEWMAVATYSEARLALPEKLPRACRDGALQVLCPPAQARQVAQILHDAGS